MAGFVGYFVVDFERVYEFLFVSWICLGGGAALRAWLGLMLLDSTAAHDLWARRKPLNEASNPRKMARINI